MRRAPIVIAITALYTALSGLSIYAWLGARGIVPEYAAFVCALPPVLSWLVTRNQTLEARERIVRAMACFAFLPFLLAIWATSLEIAPGPAESAEPPDTLSPDQLFAGAIARQELPRAAGTGFSTSAASFPDGSELRLTRFADANAAQRYLALLVESFQASDSAFAGRRGKSAQLSPELMAYWELHGASLLELRAQDPLLARARLAAQKVPPPPAASTSEPRGAASPWLLFGAALVHLGAFVVLTLWAAAATTRVPAAADAAPLASGDLLARIDALPQLGARCRVTRGQSAHERVIEIELAEAERARRLTVAVDEPGHVLRCFELETAKGAIPRDADEASMRSPGERSYDPTRPDAQRIWNVKRQATPIEQARLAAIPLRFAQDRPQLPAGYGESLDADGIIHLLCALVISAGYDYQPVLALFHGGSRKP
jgi:hypothetical protein